MERVSSFNSGGRGGNRESSHAKASVYGHDRLLCRITPLWPVAGVRRRPATAVCVGAPAVAKRPLRTLCLIGLLAPCIVLGQIQNQASDVPLRLHSLVLVKRLSSYELPSYPAASIRGSVEGLVALDIAVGADGQVTSANVYIAPDDAIRRSVEQTMSHWRFRRATIHGIAHPCLARLVMYFRLVDGVPKVIVPGLTDLPK